MLQFFGGRVLNRVWLGLIGMFLYNAAKASYQQVLIRQMLGGEPVERFMNPRPVVVPPETDLRHRVEDYVYRHHRKAFPVSANGHVAGVVTTDSLARYPRGEWDRHTVAEAMNPDVGAVSIAPGPTPWKHWVRCSGTARVDCW